MVATHKDYTGPIGALDEGMAILKKEQVHGVKRPERFVNVEHAMGWLRAALPQASSADLDALECAIQRLPKVLCSALVALGLRDDLASAFTEAVAVLAE